MGLTRAALALTLGLVAVLVITGVVLTFAYRPAPAGPQAVRAVHRLASALLLPASWVLAFALVRTWARCGHDGRGRRWRALVAPAVLVAAVPAAAFTGFLLPWERVLHATAVVPPDVSGMGPAFDAAVAAVSFGGAPVARATYQRYVLAHLALGLVVVGVVGWSAARRAGAVRAGGRTTAATGSPPPGRTPAPPPRTTG
ncbi:MAG: hypothetical protein H6518_04485 [Microthrixaceae bacterium]|nr:hypothetical protein [Microthrixaceae bacterium]